MVVFRQDTSGYTVIANKMVIGYISKFHGLIIDKSTVHGPVMLSADDLKKIADKTAEVTQKDIGS